MENTSNFTDYHEDSEVVISEMEYAFNVINKGKEVFKVYLPFMITFGCFFNILTLTVLIRRRLHLKHEGFFYLGTILVINILDIITYFCLWLYLINHSLDIQNTSEAVCKIWNFYLHVLSSDGWLWVAILLNVYLREKQLIQSANQLRQKFASMYCTLFGTKLVVGLFFFLFGLVNLWFLICFTRYEDSMCDFNYIILGELWTWLFVAICFSRFLPFVVFIPVLSFMITFCRRRLTRMSLTQIRDDISGSEEYTKASLASGVAVFIFQFPYFIVNIIMDFGDYFNGVFEAFFVSYAISIIQHILVPVFYLAIVAEMKEDVRLIFKGCYSAALRCGNRFTKPTDDRRVLQMSDLQD